MLLYVTVDNCVRHFQNIHAKCADDSVCKRNDYVPNYIIPRSPVSVRLLQEFLHSLTLYKHAQDYVLSKDNFYIESFNNIMFCIVR